MNRVLYACDVGSVKSGTFAWARVEPGALTLTTSTSIDALVARLRDDLYTARRSVALGFESPLFLPEPEDSTELCRGRKGDGNRSVFAPAGGFVTTLGLHEAAWVLRAIRDPHVSAPTYSLDWKAWPPPADAPTLLLWEAFVSGPAHSDSHARDAATAAVYFRGHEHELDAVNAVTTERPFNLVHCAALWAGWASDVERLHHPCLVLKPSQAYGGAIEVA